MLERRVHILLDDGRFSKVAREAKRRGISVPAVIREAIDRLTVETEQRRAAIAAILAAPPMSVPADAADLRREPDDARDSAAR